jgi:hypothetical protein
MRVLRGVLFGPLREVRDCPDGGGRRDGALLSRRAAGAGGFHYRLEISGQRLRALINSTNGYRADLTASVLVPGGRWIHLAATYDLAEVRLHLDGTLVGVAAYQHPLGPDNTPVMLGAAQTAAGVEGRLTGTLDELLLYDRALSAQEILDLARGVEPRLR